MSGIVGIVNRDGRPVDAELLRGMTEYLAFRGPDAQEIWVDGAVGFGHAMLRTTFEAEHESQPCTLDGQVWITADARIDGRTELMSKLDAKGRVIAGDITDPELILHAYVVWGSDCVEHLLGDFAFAIWDGRQRQLFCARDHFGVKPFYYAEVSKGLLFSNTLNCLRTHPEVTDELNDLAIADFLMFGFNNDRGTSSFRDIQRLAPAHTLTLAGRGGLAIRRYWRIPVEPMLRWRRREDYIECFVELLRQAVADRLRTRKASVLMSGGIDSTSVTVLAHEHLSANGESFVLRPCCFVFQDMLQDDESPYAQMVADDLGIPLDIVTDEGTVLFGGAERPAWQTPEPIETPTRELGSRMHRVAAKHGRATLTGFGGDPVLYPSPSFVSNLLTQRQLWLLARELGCYLAQFKSLPPLYLRSRMWSQRGRSALIPQFPPWFEDGLSEEYRLEVRWQEFQKTYSRSARHPFRAEALRNLDTPYWQYKFETLLDSGLEALPVESRHPFFDARLVSFLLRLPPWPWFIDKHIVREAMISKLPEAVRLRPKSYRLGHKSALQTETWRLDGGQVTEYIDSIKYNRIVQRLARLKQNESWLIERPVALNLWLNQL